MSKISLGVTGILFVILGIVCISNPVGTLYAGAWIIGLLALIAGIFNLIFTMRTQHFLPNSASRMLSALLEIFVGIIVLTHKAAMTAFLPMIVAVWVMVESLSLAIDSFDFKKARFRYWWAFLLLGIAGTVLGILGVFNPFVAGTTLSTLVGIGIIAIGVCYLLALFGIRKLENFFRTATLSGHNDIDEQ